MKQLLWIALAVVLVIALIALILHFTVFKKETYDETRIINGENYRLTFYDDFDKFDKRKWECCPEWERGNIGGHWRDSQVRVENGCLILTTAVDEKNKPISGAVHTQGKFEQAKGYFECRCQVQKNSGLWTAFWLMCPEVSKVGNGAKDGAEIDIMESYDAQKHMINHAIHWDGYGKDHKSLAKPAHSDAAYEGFHTYALLWTEKAYIFYIDGEETFRTEEGDDNYPGCNKAATYLVLSVEAGTWAGVFFPTQFPEDSMIVDYVKVYQKCD